MNANDLITVDPDVLGGTPVFKGTRVLVKTLFEYLEGNYTLDEFLECFPSVTRQMACQLLDRSESALLTARGSFWMSAFLGRCAVCSLATNAPPPRSEGGVG